MARHPKATKSGASSKPAPRRAGRTRKRSEADDSEYKDHTEDNEGDLSSTYDIDADAHRQKRQRNSEYPEKNQKIPLKTEVVAWTHYQLRLACRRALKDKSTKIAKNTTLKVWLGGDWYYDFDPDELDVEVCRRKCMIDKARVEKIQKEVYHKCIVTSKGTKFQNLLRDQCIHKDSVDLNLAQICEDGFTKEDSVEVKMTRKHYEQICSWYRKLVVEQVTTFREKCFKPTMIIFKPGDVSGAKSVVRNANKKLSDKCEYKSEWAWLTTCKFKEGRPVPAEATAVIASADAEITEVAADIDALLVKYFHYDKTRIAKLWAGVMKTIFKTSANDLITKEEKDRAMHLAERSFTLHAEFELLKQGRAERQNPKWLPAPSVRKQFMIKYNADNNKSDTVQEKYESIIKKTVAKHESEVQGWIAANVQIMQNEFNTQVNNCSFLEFDSEGGIQSKRDKDTHEVEEADGGIEID